MLTTNYLKMADQKLVEPIGILLTVVVDLQGMEVRLDFEVLDIEGFQGSYMILVGQPWGYQM